MDFGSQRFKALFLAHTKAMLFYQTKTTKAASYVGKVLITVKGIEPFVASRIN